MSAMPLSVEQSRRRALYVTPSQLAQARQVELCPNGSGGQQPSSITVDARHACAQCTDMRSPDQQVVAGVPCGLQAAEPTCRPLLRYCALRSARFPSQGDPDHHRTRRQSSSCSESCRCVHACIFAVNAMLSKLFHSLNPCHGLSRLPCSQRIQCSVAT